MGAAQSGGTEGGATPAGGSPRSARFWSWVATLVALVWLVAAAPLGMAAGGLSDLQTNEQSVFLPLNAESTEVDRISEGFREESDLPAIVVYTAGEGEELDERDLAAIRADAEETADRPWVRGEVVGPLPSESDPGVAQMVVPVAETVEAGEAVTELRELLDDRDDGLTALVTGPAGFVADLGAAFAGIDTTLLAVALTAVLIILVVVYRSPTLPLLVILAAVLALALASGLVYVAADAGWIELNGQSQGILFILVVGACTDYALLLVARYREALRARRRPVDALAAALRGATPPILASGGTVILGVLCLLASDLASNRGLGPVAALGIVGALAAALTFLPAVLLLAGRAAFWPTRPRYLPAAAGTDPEAPPSAGGRATLWERVAQLVARRPRAVWITTALLLALAAAAVPQFRAEGTAQTDLFRTEVESVTGQRILEDSFEAAIGTPALIVAGADHAEEVAEVASGVPGVEGVVPVSDGSGAPPGVAGPEAAPPEPEVVDGRVLLEAGLDAPAESIAAQDTVRTLRAELAEVSGAEAMVGGQAAVALDTLETSSRDLRVVIPLVLLTVLLVLVALLRALVAPVVLVATTVLSFGTALGVGALVFNHVLDLPGADPAVPLFAFVFLVALGIDYNIFLVTRIREEVPRRGHRAATTYGLAVTGGVITSAGVVLAATFSALAVIPLLFLLQIAFLVAFGVLLDTLVVRSLLVPALSLEIGPWMWWPSRLGREVSAGEAAR